MQFSTAIIIMSPPPRVGALSDDVQGWAQCSFVEAEAEVEAERLRQRRGKAAVSLTEARQGRDRELEAEARQTKFEARPRRGDP